MAPFRAASPAEYHKEKILCASIRRDTTYSAEHKEAVDAFLVQFVVSQGVSVLY